MFFTQTAIINRNLKAHESKLKYCKKILLLCALFTSIIWSSVDILDIPLCLFPIYINYRTMSSQDREKFEIIKDVTKNVHCSPKDLITIFSQYKPIFFKDIHDFPRFLAQAIPYL